MFKVMFLCTGNSCRSQMAEGFARHYGKGLLEVHSAGVMPAGVSPYAVKVMAELGVDISGQRSKGMDARLVSEMDLIVTLCGNAEALCPATSPRVKRLHWPIEDPTNAAGSEEAIINANRRTRDEIKISVIKLVEDIQNGRLT